MKVMIVKTVENVLYYGCDNANVYLYIGSGSLHTGQSFDLEVVGDSAQRTEFKNENNVFFSLPKDCFIINGDKVENIDNIKLWRCPECNYQVHVDYDALVEGGNPRCTDCDIEMV